MVNQKLALRTGFVPCSTVKPVTALAALTEGMGNKTTTIFTSRYRDRQPDAGPGA